MQGLLTAPTLVGHYLHIPPQTDRQTHRAALTGELLLQLPDQRRRLLLLLRLLQALPRELLRKGQVAEITA